MKIGIRINALTAAGQGQQSLPYMEAHGKRLDQSSQRRRVRDAPPLVWGTLDLQAAYAAHVAGCRMNQGLKKPILHAIAQFPRELAQTEEDRRKLLHHAVDFVNASHGGAAVFAARVDQDEEGLAAVDIFFSPKYEKKTKKTAEMWISTTRHGKLLAEKHAAVIRRRNKDKFNTKPRSIGIALQEEFYAYGTHVMGLDLTPRTEKVSSESDRVETEAYKARREAEALAAEAKTQAQETLSQASAVAERMEAVARMEVAIAAQAHDITQRADAAEAQMQEAAARVAEAAIAERDVREMDARARNAWEQAQQLRADYHALAEQQHVLLEEARAVKRQVEAEQETAQAVITQMLAQHEAEMERLSTLSRKRRKRREVAHHIALSEAIEDTARAAAELAARMIIGIFTGITPQQESDQDNGLASLVAATIAALLDMLADWWSGFKARVEALPEHERPKPPNHLF